MMAAARGEEGLAGEGGGRRTRGRRGAPSACTV